MVRSKLLTFLILSLFLISFVMAQGCADEGWKGYGRIHTNKTVTITCPTCDYINFTATNPSQEVFLSEVEMNKTGNTFTYIFSGSDLSSVGTYQVDGYSNLDLPLSYCFDITITGKQNSVETYAILLLICFLMFMFLLWINLKFNLEKRSRLYNQIVDGYFQSKNNSEKNLGKVILFTIGYGVLRNLFVFYYLILVFFLFILTELIESMGISSLILLLTTILNISLWGFILVFIIMIFGILQLIMELLNDVTDSYMGVSHGK